MSESEQSASAQMEAAVARWQALKKQAEGGELRLDTQVGAALAQHAEQMRTKLDAMIVSADNLKRLNGFGTLTSAEDLRVKFASKASSGDDSAVKRLKQSVQVLTLMSETYNLAIGKLTQSDQAAADKLAQLDMGDS
ncbi:hypothetical protein AB0M22_36510 [Nocardia sp. NPDC051756]|uniref:hypothetical protein n=1 Tax=Nocardia sp. NPDC051756 TaxID=3154751 RepID=UPI00342D661F